MLMITFLDKSVHHKKLPKISTQTLLCVLLVAQKKLCSKFSAQRPKNSAIRMICILIKKQKYTELCSKNLLRT